MFCDIRTLKGISKNSPPNVEIIGSPKANESQAMQPGFFDLDERHEQLEKLGDPLPELARVVDWESFRPVLEKAHQKERKSNAGRKPFDGVLMFKVLVLQHFYTLADDQTEYQIRDRHSFCRFLGLPPEGKVPDVKTLWLFRERLKALGLVKELFAELMVQIEMAGYIPRRGQIEVPLIHNLFQFLVTISPISVRKVPT